MSDPWAEFRRAPAAPAAPAQDPWAEFRPSASAAPEEEKPVWSGTVLPFSQNAKGKIYFDSNAGWVGGIKQMFGHGHNVATGKIDPRSEEGIQRTFDAALQAFPVSPAARVAGGGLPLRREKVKPPTAEALKAAGSQGYDAVRGMGVDYSSGAVKSMSSDMRMRLEADGFRPKLAPNTHSILDELANPPPNSVAPLDGLIAARRALGEIAGNFKDSTEQRAARAAIARLDEFLEGSDPSSVVAGPAAAAARAYKDANANYAAGKRSEALNNIGDSAELRAATTHSGQNVGNTIRQKLASALEDPRKSAGFSDEELAQIERAARGTVASNSTRFAGNLLGGGGGLAGNVSAAVGATLGSAAGGVAGGVAGALAPVAGYGLKKVSSALTKRQLDKADLMTRRRSPLHEKMQQEAPLTPVSPEGRAALARALLASQEQHYEGR